MVADDKTQPIPVFNYSLPVSRLLRIGDPTNYTGLNWPDYVVQYHLSGEDIPELARMASDKILYQLDMESPETWAPVHAWRALGQLRAGESVPALMSLLRRVDDADDEYVLEEIPEVLGMIGPVAIPTLAAYLCDTGNPIWARITSSSALREIGERHPEARADCVAALMKALGDYQQADPELNAFIISRLADMKSVEAAPLVERAFLADQVEEVVMGNWKDFQIAVGLLEESSAIPDDQFILTRPYEDRLPPLVPQKSRPHAEKKEKEKKKQARQSRKRNRKKK